MPQLAFANSFWDSYDVLDKQVKVGVRRAMAKFQQLTIAELHSDKGLHLESVEKARDPRMRTIRVNDFWRGIVLAPDDGSDTFLLLNVVPHDDPTPGRRSASTRSTPLRGAWRYATSSPSSSSRRHSKRRRRRRRRYCSPATPTTCCANSASMTR